MTLDSLSADDLRAGVVGFRDLLRSHKTVLNRLNVYPVPDGDTGTNMTLTLESVVEELDGAGAEMADVTKAISYGSLMGARGNSGVILSQILRGLSSGCADQVAVDGPTLAAALLQAADGAYGAVQRPVEGTILTVVRAAADATAGHTALLDVLVAAKDGGADALARTPDLLPALKQAGVVDAGGSGLLLLLDALLTVVDGRPHPEAPEADDLPDIDQAVADVHEHDGVGDLRYEVMYFLEAPDDTIEAFKQVWSGMGDSIVVVGGDGLWNCHIHTDDIGATIEAALDVGRPRKIRITDLMEQVEEERWVREAEPSVVTKAPPGVCGVVAVAVGPGVVRILKSMGAHVVVEGGQTMNPSTSELLAAIDAVGADDVVILPNNSNIIPVAKRVDELTDKRVRVVPTRAVTEGFTALTAYDPDADADTNAAEMTEAAESLVAAEVTRAVRDSSCDVGPIEAGDWLGIGPRDIVSINADLTAAVVAMLDTLVGDEHELLTVVEGEGASVGVTRAICQWLEEHRPGVDAEVHHGGQPLYPYLFGIE